MKLGFHFLWLYSCLIGILSFSIQEMPDTLTTLLNEPILEDSNAHKKEHKEKEFPKEEEEEEESERKEKEEEDSSEDIEIEEEFSKQNPSLSKTLSYFKQLNFSEEKQLNKHSNTTHSYFIQSYPPFYILFACLKIDC